MEIERDRTINIKHAGVKKKVSNKVSYLSLLAAFGAVVFLISWFSIDLERLQHENIASAYSVMPVKVSKRSPRVSLPEEVRGIYWTTSTAGSKARRDSLIRYMQKSGLNTVVIDLKADNGTLAIHTKKSLLEYAGKRSLISDLPELLDELRELNIYRIARIAVMRDGSFVLSHPELGVKNQQGELWQDSIGSLWVDPAASEVSDYALALGLEAWRLGFDEIQYDYVRFPSDGNLGTIEYPVYDGEKSKVEVMGEFFSKLGGYFKEANIPVSFDLFGMTLIVSNDFGIGQRLLEAYPYADFISAMVYPSHYSPGFRGHANPAEAPYDVVWGSLEDGADLLEQELGELPERSRSKQRPWLQDFDIGAIYTAELIEAQIKATRDSGASGWLLWNARNVYEPANYL